MSCSHGLYSYGLYSYGIYSYGIYIAMAFIAMTYMVTACMVMPCIAIAYVVVAYKGMGTRLQPCWDGWCGMMTTKPSGRSVAASSRSMCASIRWINESSNGGLACQWPCPLRGYGRAVGDADIEPI